MAKDVYKVTVEMWRDYHDDLPVIEEKFPMMREEEALKRQITEELQEACDRGILAGSFNVIKLEK